jgi:hypothetical protein
MPTRAESLRRVVLIGLSLALPACIHKSEQPEYRFVPFCDLVKNPAAYDRTIVRTRALFCRNPEEIFLADDACGTQESLVWVEDSTTREGRSSRSVIRHLKALWVRDGKAMVTIVGRFHGPREVEVPPGTPPAAAEILRYVNSKYGHLSSFRFMLEPMLIEDAKEASPPGVN